MTYWPASVLDNKIIHTPNKLPVSDKLTKIMPCLATWAAFSGINFQVYSGLITTLDS